MWYFFSEHDTHAKKNLSPAGVCTNLITKLVPIGYTPQELLSRWGGGAPQKLRCGGRGAPEIKIRWRRGAQKVRQRTPCFLNGIALSPHRLTHVQGGENNPFALLSGNYCRIWLLHCCTSHSQWFTCHVIDLLDPMPYDWVAYHNIISIHV